MRANDLPKERPCQAASSKLASPGFLPGSPEGARSPILDPRGTGRYSRPASARKIGRLRWFAWSRSEREQGDGKVKTLTVNVTATVAAADGHGLLPGCSGWAQDDPWARRAQAICGQRNSRRPVVL